MTCKLKTLNVMLLSVGLASLPATLLAQEAAPADSAPESAKPAARKEKMQEVVITASRRSERLQDVPLSVTAVSAEQLGNSGVKSVTELGSAMSGISFGSSPNDAGFRIRGAGQMGGFSSAAETPVGVVVDNVVFGLGPGVDSLGDIERVEVLKGPQGTQFGKNASSGVVSITTPRPSFDRIKGDTFLSYGSDNESEVRTTLNIPLGQTVATRLSAYHRKYDGFIDNVSRNETWGGQTQKGFRGKLLFKPSSNFDALLIADYSKNDQKGPGQTWTLRNPPPAITSGYPFRGGPLGDVVPSSAVLGGDNLVSFEDAPGHVRFKRSGVSLELNYQLGGYTLTSISAYRTDKTDTAFSIDGTPYDIFRGTTLTDKTQTTQELRVTSPKGGALEYVAGYYYYRQPTETESWAYLRPALPFAPVHVALNNGIATSNTESVSNALFADGKVRLTASGDTKALFGVRVNRDEVEASNFSVRDPNFPAPAAPYTPLALRTGDVSKTGTSGRLGLEHRLDKDFLVYGTAATGFLGPTVAFSGLTSTRTDVKPQKVRDVTLGFKAQFLDRWVTLNGSIFHDKYTDLQTAVFDGTEFLTENAGGARTRGVELDLTARLNSQLRLRASATYADAKFTDYLTACPGAADASICSGAVVGGRPLFFQAAGEQVPGAPKLTAVLGLDYSTEIGAGLFDASVNYNYRSRTSYQVGVPANSQDAYGVLNLAAHYAGADDRWRLGVYVRNALDKRFHAAVIGLPFAAPGGTLNWATYEGAGRHAGVTLELRY
ncbi:TonB-dependent receptor [Massilia niastensis]|uniref:TonB-dependent receptor n=1 Tax=Massilia niastensis TaxID=544911 RepID=UPI00037ACC90|nr:TonB-dependent receptor [Massilia niastensis]